MKILISISLCFILTTAAVYAHHDITSDRSAIGYWLLDEGAGEFAYDRLGNQRHGELINSPEWREDGKFNGCLYLAGRAQLAKIEGLAADIHGDEFTLMAWIKVQDNRERDCDILSLVTPRTGKHQPHSYISVALAWNHVRGKPGGIRWRYGPNISKYNFKSEVNGEWQHIAFTYSLSNHSENMFHNGEMIDTVGDPYEPRPGDFHIGGRTQYSFQRFIDEVAMFARALSRGEISGIMRHGIAGFLGVNPSGTIASTWGEIKR